MQDLHDITHGELLAALEELGQPKFRAKQVEEWLWEKGVASFDEMTNLPKALRTALAERYTLGGMEQLARQVSEDGSRKYLLRLGDGAAVECVGMPTGSKLAVCASSQAGCAMGCAFCATGAAGLTRSLTASEIYGQVMHVRDDFDTRVTSVVLMGQGEPFANYDAGEMLGVIRWALDVWRNPDVRKKLVKQAMESDFSFNRCAKSYADLYKQLL